MSFPPLSEAFIRHGRGDRHTLSNNLRREQGRPGVEKIRLPRHQRQVCMQVNESRAHVTTRRHFIDTRGFIQQGL